MNTVKTLTKVENMELPKRSHRAEKYNNQLENALEGFNSKLDETEE